MDIPGLCPGLDRAKTWRGLTRESGSRKLDKQEDLFADPEAYNGHQRLVGQQRQLYAPSLAKQRSYADRLTTRLSGRASQQPGGAGREQPPDHPRRGAGLASVVVSRLGGVRLRNLPPGCRAASRAWRIILRVAQPYGPAGG